MQRVGQVGVAPDSFVFQKRLSFGISLFKELTPIAQVNSAFHQMGIENEFELLLGVWSNPLVHV